MSSEIRKSNPAPYLKFSPESGIRAEKKDRYSNFGLENEITMRNDTPYRI
jgi:hypothetical protein